MDEVQKVLVEAGRKDLAQEYYKKTAIDLSPEKFTGYEKLMKSFNVNGVTIKQSEVDQLGDDFEGFEAEIEGTLSNGIKFKYTHDQKGIGAIKIETKKGHRLIDTTIRLQNIGMGYDSVLKGYLTSILNFDF